jgi:hypothetical protein
MFTIRQNSRSAANLSVNAKRHASGSLCTASGNSGCPGTRPVRGHPRSGPVVALLKERDAEVHDGVSLVRRGHSVRLGKSLFRCDSNATKRDRVNAVLSFRMFPNEDAS